MFPKFNSRRDNTITISTFKGINRSKNTDFSQLSYYNSSHQIEFTDMKNMTDDYYPMFGSRAKREAISRINTFNRNAICSNLLVCNDGLMWLESDGAIYYNNEIFLQLFKRDGFDKSIKRQLTIMGNYIIVTPDKIRINISTKENEQIENIFYSAGGNGEIEIIDADVDVPSVQRFVINTTIEQQKLKYMGAIFVDPTDDSYQKKEITIDRLSVFNQVGNIVEFFDYGDKSKRSDNCTAGLFLLTDIEKDTACFNNQKKIFTEIYANYVKIIRTGIGKGFNVGDTVEISEINNKCTKTYRGKIGDWVDTLNGVFTIYDVSDDYIVIDSILDKSVPYSGPIKVSRTMPDMDYIIERNNRLWGCSSENHEIYCCAIGDCKNWNTYQDAIASDSWACTVGTQGDFTGLIRIGDYLYFFKENCIHRISGEYPSNFTETTIYQSGVEAGSEQSLVAVGSSLYYKSPAGITKFTEGYANELISNAAFDSQRYVNAVAGRHKNKVYMSLQNVITGDYEVYVYNTDTNLIMKEDDTQFTSTATLRDNMYFVDADTGYINSISDNNVFTDFASYVHPDRLSNQRTFNLHGNQRLFGDVDGDGEITQQDVDLLQKHITKEITLDDDALLAADVTGDKQVTVKDVTALTNYVHDMKLVYEDDISWSFTTGNLFESDLSNEKIKKLQIRAEITGDAELLILTNNNSHYQKIKEFKGLKNQNVYVPIFVQRCDYLKIKMQGTGTIILKYIDIKYLGGSSK
jgi:hypothetical protein